MVRLGLGAMLALCVACGGRSEQRANAGNGGNAGANLGGGSGTAAGIGGSSGAGQAGTGGTLGGRGGAGGAGGTISKWVCDQSTLIESHGPIPEDLVPGFSGTIDANPVTLAPPPPNSPSPVPGTITAAATSCGDMAYEVSLTFDEPYANETLIVLALRSDGCEMSGRYLLAPDMLNPFPAEVQLDLRVWANDEAARPTLHGFFSALVRSPDGILVHTIEGELTVEAEARICI